MTPDIPLLSDIEELDENSGGAIGCGTFDKSSKHKTPDKEKEVLPQPLIRRETFSPSEGDEVEKLLQALALEISPPAKLSTSQKTKTGGIALEISPPGKIQAEKIDIEVNASSAGSDVAFAFPLRPKMAAASLQSRRSFAAPSQRVVVDRSVQLTSTVTSDNKATLSSRGVDRYRARSSVGVSVRASSSTSRNEASADPACLPTSAEANQARRSQNLEAASSVVRKTPVSKIASKNAKGNNDPNTNSVAKKSMHVKHLAQPSSVRSLTKTPVSRLSLIKPIKTPSSIIHHPNPYAARNMYYDERWIEKQENGFKKWLNFVLTPPDGFDCTENDRVLLAPGKLDVAKLWTACTKDVRVPRAPTREVLSMRAYSVHRQLKRLRRDAATLWQSPSIAPVNVRLVRVFYTCDGMI